MLSLSVSQADLHTVNSISGQIWAPLEHKCLWLLGFSFSPASSPLWASHEQGTCQDIQEERHAESSSP